MCGACCDLWTQYYSSRHPGVFGGLNPPRRVQRNTANKHETGAKGILVLRDDIAAWQGDGAAHDAAYDLGLGLGG